MNPIPEELKEQARETERIFRENKGEDGWRWRVVQAKQVDDKVMCWMVGRAVFNPPRKAGNVLVYLKDGIIYPYFGDM
jgi:hypothetical protein